MKTKLIIGFLALACAFVLTTPSANAQGMRSSVKDIIPATHMWIRTGDALVHIYVNTLEQCKIFTKQAAYINSSQARCYNGQELVGTADCQKSTHSNTEPKCK